VVRLIVGSSYHRRLMNIATIIVAALGHGKRRAAHEVLLKAFAASIGLAPEERMLEGISYRRAE
jgi:hypothetical protein